jgi:hypothetical protein
MDLANILVESGRVFRVKVSSLFSSWQNLMQHYKKKIKYRSHNLPYLFVTLRLYSVICVVLLRLQ